MYRIEETRHPRNTLIVIGGSGSDGETERKAQQGEEEEIE